MGMKPKFDMYKFEPKDIKKMDIRGDEALGFMTMDKIDARIEALSEIGESWTVVIDDEILFCAGYYELWSGVAECWILPSKNVRALVGTFVHIINSFFREKIEKTNIHRLQTVAKNDSLHARWMEYLKFKNEGTMKRYSHDKQDYCMYARFF